MRFFMDQNVDGLVAASLKERGHDVSLLVEHLPPNAEDHVVATTAMELERVLVSHDRDMRKIERFISDGWRKRYPDLCRIMLSCSEMQSSERFLLFLPAIELEFKEAAASNCPMMVDIGEKRVRIVR